MFFLLLFCVCCLCVLLSLCLKKTVNKPPNLSGGLPFIGHGLLFVGDNSIKSYKNITWVAEECMKKGGILAGYFGFRRAYCLTDAESIWAISNSCLEKDYMYTFAKGFVGDGLITSNAVVWKKHRKLLNPAFSKQVLDSFIQSFNEKAKHLVNQLTLSVEKPCNHEKTLKENNLESICLTATGIGGVEYGKLQQQYLSLIPKFQMIVYERFKRFWLHSNLIYKFSELKKVEDKVMETCSNLSEQIIQRKREEMKLKSKTTRNSVKPFLELILDISNEKHCFTDEQIRHETDTIIAAGHETSANLLNIALILIGSYPEIQNKIYKEVIEVFGNTDRDLNKEDLMKLVYTEAVLKETLRLYPPVPVVARFIDKDIKLRNYTLQANSACFFMLNGLNRDPAWGQNANQFVPERWLDLSSLPGASYFGSFSIGKRNCIGKAYAMMSMKISLAYIVRRYLISADITKVVFKWHMLTYPASGHHYTLHDRNDDFK